MNAFGLSVIRLDIRQESARHTDVLNTITEYLEMGSYAEWDEETRLAFLLRELRGRRPLLPPGMPMSEDAQEVVDTFRVISCLPSDSLGAYVISMAKAASDVLAVMLLQRECGVKPYLRVVPLFETLADLDNAPNAIRQLLSDSWYHQTIEGKQECMIGYSDSGRRHITALACLASLSAFRQRCWSLGSGMGTLPSSARTRCRRRRIRR